MPFKQPDRSKWIQAIEEVQTFDEIVQTYYICEFHFSPDDIVKRGKKKCILPNRVPSIFANNAEIDDTLQCSDENGNLASIEVNVSTKTCSAVDNALDSVFSTQYVSNTDDQTNESRLSSSAIDDRYIRIQIITLSFLRTSNTIRI